MSYHSRSLQLDLKQDCWQLEEYLHLHICSVRPFFFFPYLCVHCQRQDGMQLLPSTCKAVTSIYQYLYMCTYMYTHTHISVEIVVVNWMWYCWPFNKPFENIKLTLMTVVLLWKCSSTCRSEVLWLVVFNCPLDCTFNFTALIQWQ